MSIITREVNSIAIGQRPEDGYVNLTKMTQACGKQIGHYLSNQVTKEFLQALSTDIGIPISGLIQVSKGGLPIGQGTWAHPQVAIHCAQWCSPEFAVLVTKWVFEWMAQGKTPTDRPEALPTEISALISETNNLYGKFEVAITEATPALLLARQIGDRLLQLKAKIPHGSWEDFRERNIKNPSTGLPMPSSTASLYQRVAKYWDVLQDRNALSLKEADRVFRKVEAVPLRPVQRQTVRASQGDRVKQTPFIEYEIEVLSKGVDLGDRLGGFDEHQQAVLRHQVVELLTQGNYSRCIEVG